MRRRVRVSTMYAVLLQSLPRVPPPPAKRSRLARVAPLPHLPVQRLEHIVHTCRRMPRLSPAVGAHAPHHRLSPCCRARLRIHQKRQKLLLQVMYWTSAWFYCSLGLEVSVCEWRMRQPIGGLLSRRTKGCMKAAELEIKHGRRSARAPGAGSEIRVRACVQGNAQVKTRQSILLVGSSPDKCSGVFDRSGWVCDVVRCSGGWMTSQTKGAAALYTCSQGYTVDDRALFSLLIGAVKHPNEVSPRPAWMCSTVEMRWTRCATSSLQICFCRVASRMRVWKIKGRGSGEGMRR